MTDSTSAPTNDGGGAPAEPTPSMDMTGAEAKAYVESLKQAQNKTAAPVKKTEPEAKTTPKEIAQEVARKFKVKIDGAEKEVDEAELLRGYSHQQAANKSLQEGKTLRKQSEELINILKDPTRFFQIAKELGHDPRQLSENYLVEILNEELMDPKERELKQLRKQMTTMQAVEEERKQSLEQERQRLLKEKYAKQFSDDFIPALQEANLPPNKEMISRMAYYVSQAAELKMPMSMKEAAKLVREDLLSTQRKVLADTSEEHILELLGPEIAAKIRKHDLAKLKNPEQFLKTPDIDSSSKRDRRVQEKRMSHKQWRDFNRS